MKPPIPVESVALKRGKGVRRIQLLGQVEASKSATLCTQTAGTVECVLVEVSDHVTPGMRANRHIAVTSRHLAKILKDSSGFRVFHPASM